MNPWRLLFAFAALFNGAVGGAMLAAPGPIAARLNIEGDGGPFAIATAGILIAVFGLGYAMVAAAPVQNRGIVWIGLVGKVGVATLGAMQYVAGIVPMSTFALGLVDLAFVAAFAAFLWLGPRPS